MPVENKAERVKGGKIKPSDNKTKEVCPCKTFDRCRLRQPYGADVWCGPKKSKAMDCIAYSYKKVITSHRAEVLKGLQEKTNVFNPFYTNLKGILGNDWKSWILAFPEITDDYIETNMREVENNLYNTAKFTYFQISIILRANIVRSGVVMRSDLYKDRKNNIKFPQKELVPYGGWYPDIMWSVDHIQVRAKGGCNRFCNATVLARHDNTDIKNDRGPGCPCVHVIDKNSADEPGADQQKFMISKPGEEGGTRKKEPQEGGRYDLYECIDYYMAKGKVKLPDEPCGTCDDKHKCNLDDPRTFTLQADSKRKKIRHVRKVSPLYKPTP